MIVSSSRLRFDYAYYEYVTSLDKTRKWTNWNGRFRFRRDERSLKNIFPCLRFPPPGKYRGAENLMDFPARVRNRCSTTTRLPPVCNNNNHGEFEREEKKRKKKKRETSISKRHFEIQFFESSSKTPTFHPSTIRANPLILHPTPHPLLPRRAKLEYSTIIFPNPPSKPPQHAVRKTASGASSDKSVGGRNHSMASSGAGGGLLIFQAKSSSQKSSSSLLLRGALEKK